MVTLYYMYTVLKKKKEEKTKYSFFISGKHLVCEDLSRGKCQLSKPSCSDSKRARPSTENGCFDVPTLKGMWRFMHVIHFMLWISSVDSPPDKQQVNCLLLQPQVKSQGTYRLSHFLDLVSDGVC